MIYIKRRFNKQIHQPQDSVTVSNEQLLSDTNRSKSHQNLLLNKIV